MNKILYFLMSLCSKYDIIADNEVENCMNKRETGAIRYKVRLEQ